MRNSAALTSNNDLCVVIVEDNDHMRTLLRTLLKAMGIRRVVEFVEGSEALAQLAATKPDFILTDLSMAPMDGLHFTRAVRHHPDQTLCVIPIVMVTGHTERRRIFAARDVGVTEILAKPVTPSGLYHRIDEIVHRPRQFVRSADYCGPDRRRKRDPNYTGPWRRQTDAQAGETVAVDQLAAVTKPSGAQPENSSRPR